MESPGDITRLLEAARGGEPGALQQVFPIVYDELRRIARRQLSRRGGGGTLDTTAVVHEAYLKLVRFNSTDLRDREHFYAVAATAMRQILVDHARRRLAQKRGAGARRTELDDRRIQVSAMATEMIDLDAALQRLEALDARLARIVHLRFFAGRSIEEIAEILNRTPRTVLRDWRKARAFLHQDLEGGPTHD